MEENPQIQVAFDYLEHTDASVFLTGKAGTGKTTFLRELRQRCPKRMVVLAPTGVAAINAGGVTIHSFFQLPFAPYIPGSTVNQDKKYTNKFSKEKIDIIRTMDLLVIDEISMVRADLLDLVSETMCKYRGQTKPFGGVQLLMIGDLQQLAPVVKEEEWALLHDYYTSPYFFCSRALKELAYVPIELVHVYRQADERFIDILNKIRENRADAGTFAALNKRYIPHFNPSDEEGYITLTTHNAQANSLNQKKLSMIQERAYTYDAEIKDNFPEFAYPTDRSLVLKKGAQVMFVKNDSSGEHRYYNGKIGRVTSISSTSVTVACNDGSGLVEVKPEEWTNSKYTIDSETKEITEVVEGVFRQLPLKTAWAITIHKSQGLTFEKAIIDAAASFAHGQVYVALSRCKTLEGMVLSAPLSSTVLRDDSAVRNFTMAVSQHQITPDHLYAARRSFWLQQLCELFDCTPLMYALSGLCRLYEQYFRRLYPEFTQQFASALERCKAEMKDIGDRFRTQLTRMTAESSDYENDLQLKERIARGQEYFVRMCEDIIAPLLSIEQPDSDNQVAKKAIPDAYQRFYTEAMQKKMVFESAATGFDTTSYLNARAKARLEKMPQMKKKTSAKAEVSTDIKHPRLYIDLSSWRKEEAERLGVPPYTIFQQKALLGIVNMLPTDSKELLTVPGIGKKIVEKYGAVILDFVDRYRFKLDHSMV